MVKKIMQAHYSTQLSRVSAWLIKTNYSTCRYQRVPSEQYCHQM